jgi:hypothetical protein
VIDAPAGRIVRRFAEANTAKWLEQMVERALCQERS